MCGNRLGPFVLVVRELEVEPPAVEIEIFAEQIERHDHALGVPARATVAEGRGPTWLVRLGVLPQGEVQRRTLLLTGLDARAGAKTFEGLTSQKTVVGHLETSK